jgi:hypothetical protein
MSANSRKNRNKFGVGTLLRIKNLEKFSGFLDGEFVCESLIEHRYEYSHRESFLSPHTISFKKIFATLPLSGKLDTSYVAKIVHIVYPLGSKYPTWVGVKFYTSYNEATGNGNHLWTDSKNRVFYYHLSNTMTLDHLKEYESLDAGDLITYGDDKSGIVISNTLSRRKHISTHGITRHVIKYFNKDIRIQYLYPERKFKKLG